MSSDVDIGVNSSAFGSDVDVGVNSSAFGSDADVGVVSAVVRVEINAKRYNLHKQTHARKNTQLATSLASITN